MDSYTAQHLLYTIADMPGKNDKIAMLEELLEDDFFRTCVYYAYNPFYRFGVLNIWQTDKSNTGMFTPDTFYLLEDLRNGELTGDAARAAVQEEMNGLDEDSAALLYNILHKDLRAGFSDKSINKARKGTIPVMSYMRCSLLKDIKIETLPWKEGMYSQCKADGLFVNLNTEIEPTLQTRVGHFFPTNQLSDLVAAANVFPANRQVHGELVVYDPFGTKLDRKTGNGILNSLLKVDGLLPLYHSVGMIAWDMIPLEVAQGADGYIIPYKVRLEEVRQNCISRHIKLIETRKVHSMFDARLHFEELRDKGEEGTILKDPDSVWKNGTSKQQIKLKAEKECELSVIGFNEGKGKYEGTLGSLQCISEDDLLEVNISGFTDAEREKIWNDQSDWLECIITACFNEVIKAKDKEKWSLFLPRFVARRTDKTKADTLEYIQHV